MAKQQPERRFTLLYDKVCRQDILQEAWQRVKSNKGAAGVDQVDIDAIRDYGEDRFLNELEQELRSRQYRTALVRRVHIPKPGQPGKTRPLGIPTVKDRVVQMAVKLVIEPLFEADFLPCSFGFRPKRTPRMALSTIVQSVNDGYSFVVDVDLKSYFDTISHELLLRVGGTAGRRRSSSTPDPRLVESRSHGGRQGDASRPGFSSGRGDFADCCPTSFCTRWIVNGAGATVSPLGNVRLVRYADDMVLLARTEQQARVGVGATPRSVCGSSIGGEPREESADDAGRRFRVSGLRVPESSWSDAVDVATREGVPQYPAAGARSGAIVSQSNGRVDVVIQKLNPVLNGWCTYFRVGNSNRTFHKVDWAVRSELQLWLRRKHQCRLADCSETMGISLPS